jgi:hypothetical protein
MMERLARTIRTARPEDMHDRQVAVGLSFGVRANDVPGLSNNDIAEGISLVCTSQSSIRGYAQWEIAASDKWTVPSARTRTVGKGQTARMRPQVGFFRRPLYKAILAKIGSGGSVHTQSDYIDSFDVIYWVVLHARNNNITRIALGAYKYHAWRIARTMEKYARDKYGMKLDIVLIDHPVRTDPESLHPQTRSEEAWSSYEPKAFIFYWLSGLIDFRDLLEAFFGLPPKKRR